ncbi:MAG: TPM domain-containing protein [Betaproteobacteria bacterium]|nr:TPM domain-containing protein [Betaproteobacteria bacterium]
MANLNARLSRFSLYLASWALLLASVFIPAPSRLFPVDATGFTGVKVLGRDLLEGGGGSSWRWLVGTVVHWSRPLPGAEFTLTFGQEAILTLAFFANVAFLFCGLLLGSRRVSLACRIFLVAAVVVSASVAVVFPVFAGLPAYWLWFASLAVLAWAFIAFEGVGTSPKAAAAKRAESDTGDMPLVVWMWLGFVCFWLAITSLGATRVGEKMSSGAKTEIATAKPLASYVTDSANLVSPDQAAKWSATLAAFEKDTSNQIAVAILPRSPTGSIEDFTIDLAERSRLGRKGLDNGAILFVFMQEHSARLEVGYGLEGVLTDAAAHRILEQRLKPAFARGEYAEGIDATLAAVLVTVQDAYKQGLVPSEFAVMWQQVRVASPKLLKQAIPALTGLGFLPRLLSAFFGGVFATIACYVLREVVRTLVYFGRLARNTVAPAPGGAKIERKSFNAILEDLKLLGFSLEVVVGGAGFALAAIASVAGIIIIAAGGGFGGAGAMVRW